METDHGYEVKQQTERKGHPGGCLESRIFIFSDLYLSKHDVEENKKEGENWKDMKLHIM